MIKVLVIDDNLDDLDFIAYLFKKYFPHLESVYYSDPQKASVEVNFEEFDLLILDVNMPTINGFDFLERIKKHEIKVIFSTAEEKHALRAHSYATVGYLLKPYSESDFTHVLLKSIRSIDKAQKGNSEKNKPLNQLILIATIGCSYMVSTDEIIRVESINNYAKFIVSDGNSYLSSHGLSHYKDPFESRTFFRIHKSHIINIRFIEKYYSDGTLIMKNGDRVPVSRRRREEFLSHIKNH